MSEAFFSVGGVAACFSATVGAGCSGAFCFAGLNTPNTVPLFVARSRVGLAGAGRDSHRAGVPDCGQELALSYFDAGPPVVAGTLGRGPGDASSGASRTRRSPGLGFG